MRRLITKRKFQLVNVFTAFFGMLLAPVAAFAVSVPGTDLDVTWSVNHNAGSGLFEYRYTVTNNGLQAAVAQLTIAEDQLGGHAGDHSEINVIGTLLRDAAVASLPSHNYDFSNLNLGIGGSVTVGFDDLDGPRTEKWRASDGSGSAVTTTPGIPVPTRDAAPGGGLCGFWLDLGGGDIKSWTVMGWSVKRVGGVWDYSYFLKNNGNVDIGPDPNPPIDNHGDWFLNEATSHIDLHHENWAPHPDNNRATAFGYDRANAGAHSRTPGIKKDNYFWVGLAKNPGAAWVPGEVLNLGFTDIHGPGKAASGGRVVGSEDVNSCDEPYQLVEVPVPPIETPALGLWGLRLLVLCMALVAIAVAWRKRAVATCH